jgi:predicted HTH domain antitoxin
VSITLDLDDEAMRRLPLPPGERERHMQIELVCRFYAKGWLSLGQAARMAKLERFALGAELAKRGIARQYASDDLDADLKYAGGCLLDNRKFYFRVI